MLCNGNLEGSIEHFKSTDKPYFEAVVAQIFEVNMAEVEAPVQSSELNVSTVTL